MIYYPTTSHMPNVYDLLVITLKSKAKYAFLAYANIVTLQAYLSLIHTKIKLIFSLSSTNRNYI
jgi:hypothetical protein